MRRGAMPATVSRGDSGIEIGFHGLANIEPATAAVRVASGAQPRQGGAQAIRQLLGNARSVILRASFRNGPGFSEAAPRSASTCSEQIDGWMHRIGIEIFETRRDRRRQLPRARPRRHPAEQAVDVVDPCPAPEGVAASVPPPTARSSLCPRPRECWRRTTVECSGDTTTFRSATALHPQYQPPAVARLIPRRPH